MNGWLQNGDATSSPFFDGSVTPFLNSKHFLCMKRQASATDEVNISNEQEHGGSGNLTDGLLARHRIEYIMSN